MASVGARPPVTHLGPVPLPPSRQPVSSITTAHASSRGPPRRRDNYYRARNAEIIFHGARCGRIGFEIAVHRVGEHVTPWRKVDVHRPIAVFAPTHRHRGGIPMVEIAHQR